MSESTSSAPTQYQTTAVFKELMEILSSMDEKFLKGEKAIQGDPSGVLEGYKWIFSITQVAMEVYVWGDKFKPRFVEIVGPVKKWGGDNSDAFYFMAPIDPSRTYKATVDPGDAVYLSLTVYGGPDDGRYSERIVGMLNTTQMEANPDGTYTMILSPNEHEGNWIKLESDAVVAITRDYMNDPVNGRKAVWDIECLDEAPPYELTDEELARRFRTVVTWLKDQAAMVPLDLGQVNHVSDPFPVPKVTFGWAAGDAAYAMGAFELGDGEALVLRGRNPKCVFWNVCLWNQFLHTFNYDYDPVTANGSRIDTDEDGNCEIIISHEDPGVPNWISTQRRPHGRIFFRWFLPDSTPGPVAAEVVPLSELASEVAKS